VYHQSTAVLVNEAALEEFGFMTRTFRYPELESGAIRAAEAGLEIGRQDGKRYTLARAPLPALEPYDWVTFGVVIGASVAYVEGTMEVDTVHVEVSGARARAVIEGRAL
jgi:hypothetical protein